MWNKSTTGWGPHQPILIIGFKDGCLISFYWTWIVVVVGLPTTADGRAPVIRVKVCFFTCIAWGHVLGQLATSNPTVETRLLFLLKTGQWWPLLKRLVLWNNGDAFVGLKTSYDKRPLDNLCNRGIYWTDGFNQSTAMLRCAASYLVVVLFWGHFRVSSWHLGKLNLFSFFFFFFPLCQK